MRTTIIAMCLIILPCVATADDFLAAPNQNPFLRGFYIPDPITFRSWEYQRWETTLSSNNIFAVQSSANESLIVDTESTKLQISKHGRFYTKKYREFWYRIGIPLLYDSAGYLDSTIERLHNELGVSADQRSKYPQNQLQISYSALNGTNISQTKPAHGIGDLSADLGWKVPIDFQRIDDISIWTSAKAPTGSKAHLRSNGAWDVSAWIHVVKRSTWPYTLSHHLSNISLAGEAGISTIVGESIYGSNTKKMRDFARASLSLNLGNFNEITVQLDHTSSPLENTGVPLLKSNTYLTVGSQFGRWSFGMYKSANKAMQSDFGAFLRYRAFSYDE